MAETARIRRIDGEPLFTDESMVVYRAAFGSSGLPAIVRGLRPGAAGGELAKAFRRHYEAALALGTDTTPAPLYFGPDGDSIVLVLEDAGERSVAELLAHGPLPIREAIGMAARLAVRLWAMQRAGWLHRSVRPEHVLADASGRIRLIGLTDACPVAEADEDAYLVPAGIEQKRFLSPEQTGKTSRRIGWRTDLFGVGAVLYAMLVGRPPFKGDDSASVLHDCIAGIPPAPGSERPEVPAFVDAIIRKAMAKNPDERYLTFPGLVRDLRLALALGPGESGPAPGGFDRPTDLMDAPELLAPGETDSLEPMPAGRLQAWFADVFPGETLRRDALVGLATATTGGVPRQVRLFLQGLAESGDAAFEPRSGAWRLSGDPSAVASAGIGSLLPGKLAALDEATLRFLECASCVGERFDAKAVAAVLRTAEDTDALAAPAVQAGLLLPVAGTDTTLRFAHPAVREGLYGRLETIRRSTWHSAFAERYERAGRSDLAVDHILADPLKPRRRPEVVKRARTFLDAADAVAVIDPERSYQLSARARTMLGPAGWRDSYDATMAAALRTARSASSTGREEEFRAVLVDLDAEATPEDRPAVDEVAVRGLNALGHVVEALEAGLAALARLGFRVPAHPSAARSFVDAIRAGAAMRLRSDAAILSMRRLDDRVSGAVLSLVVAVAPSAYVARPGLVPVIGRKALALCLKRGMDPRLSVALAGLGIMACGVFGDYDLGYRYGRLAEDLVRESAGSSVYAAARLLSAGFITHWKRPIRETLDTILDAGRVGRTTGASEYSSFAYNMHLQYLLLTGSNLQSVQAALPEAREAIRAMRQEIPGIVFDASVAFMDAMRDGADVSTAPLLRGQTFAAWQARLAAGSQNTMSCHLAVYRALADYSYGHIEDARAALEEARPLLGSFSGHFPFAVYQILDALVSSREVMRSSAKGPHPDPKARARALGRIWRVASLMSRLGRLNPGVFGTKDELARALFLYHSGERLQASDLFEKALTRARNAGYILDEAAIASEYARCLADSGWSPLAGFYMRASYDALTRWGAFGVAASLVERFETLRDWVRSSSGYARAGGIRVVDAEALIQASRAVSGELNSVRLLDSLLEATMEVSGARSGVVWLYEDSGWRPAASASYGGATAGPDLSRAVPRLEEARDGRRTILLKDAATGTAAFVPLVCRGRVQGALQLANELVADAFPPERMTVIEAIAAQASTSIENAELYESLERKVRERTHELEEALRNVRRLKGLIPICSSCKKVRDDKGYWGQVEEYIAAHSEADFTHGLCPDCLSKYYDELGVPEADRRMEQPGSPPDGAPDGAP